MKTSAQSSGVEISGAGRDVWTGGLGFTACDPWFRWERGYIEIPPLASLGLLYPFGGGLAVDI